MSVKTPAEIAREIVCSEYALELDALETLDTIMDNRDEQTAADLIDTIEKAIMADRAQLRTETCTMGGSENVAGGIARDVLAANLASPADADQADAALLHVEFSGARVREMLTDAARLALAKAEPLRPWSVTATGEIHAAMTESGEIATYERHMAEIAAITAKIEALRAVPSANETDSDTKRTEIRELARTRRALKTRTSRMFDVYAGRVARAARPA